MPAITVAATATAPMRFAAPALRSGPFMVLTLCRTVEGAVGTSVGGELASRGTIVVEA